MPPARRRARRIRSPLHGTSDAHSAAAFSCRGRPAFIRYPNREVSMRVGRCRFALGVMSVVVFAAGCGSGAAPAGPKVLTVEGPASTGSASGDAGAFGALLDVARQQIPGIDITVCP